MFTNTKAKIFRKKKNYPHNCCFPLSSINNFKLPPVKQRFLGVEMFLRKIECTFHESLHCFTSLNSVMNSIKLCRILFRTEIIHMTFLKILFFLLSNALTHFPKIFQVSRYPIQVLQVSNFNKFYF